MTKTLFLFLMLASQAVASTAPVTTNNSSQKSYIGIGNYSYTGYPMLGIYNGTTLLPLNVDVSGNLITSGGSSLGTVNQGTGGVSPWLITTDNTNSSLAARQTVTGTETVLSAPANTVGIMFECESVNADNLRWGFSNSNVAILSSTLGVLCEPGRSVDYAPIGAGNYIHMISTGAGSDFMDIQWVLSQ